MQEVLVLRENRVGCIIQCYPAAINITITLFYEDRDFIHSIIQIMNNKKKNSLKSNS